MLREFQDDDRIAQWFREYCKGAKPGERVDHSERAFHFAVAAMLMFLKHIGSPGVTLDQGARAIDSLSREMATWIARRKPDGANPATRHVKPTEN